MNCYREKRTSTPTAPVALSALKSHLRIAHDDEDTDLQSKLSAAINWIEAQTGRQIGEATWELRFRQFPRGRRPQMLPRAPLQSVDQITYTDGAGDEQTLNSAAVASGYIVSDDEEPGRIEPIYGAVWPIAREFSGSVVYTITAGYADGTIPAEIAAAIHLLAGHLYETREDTVEGALSVAPLGYARELRQLLRFDAFINYDPRFAPEA